MNIVNNLSDFEYLTYIFVFVICFIDRSYFYLFIILSYKIYVYFYQLNSERIINKFRRLINKYHEKKRDIPNLKQLVQSIKTNRLFENLLGSENKVIIISFNNVDIEFLRKTLIYCNKNDNNNKIYITSLENPLDIVDKVNSELFTLDNVLTPYQFRQTFFSGIYKIDNNDITLHKINLTEEYLINYIVKNSKVSHENITFFGKSPNPKYISKYYLNDNIKFNYELKINR